MDPPGRRLTCNHTATLPELPVFSGVRVARSAFFCVVFCRLLFMTIVLSILRFTTSDYPFGIFKCFNTMMVTNKSTNI
jgi:hypothetical protein